MQEQLGICNSLGCLFIIFNRTYLLSLDNSLKFL